MTHSDDELQPVIDLLHAHRPEASALELDAMKQRVLIRTAKRSQQRRSHGFMRSRAAILTTLVLGFTLSTAGAGLAVSGFAGNDQASVAQYPEQVQPQTPAAPVAPGAAPAPQSAPEQQSAPEDQQVLPDSDNQAAPSPDQNEVQPARQVTQGVTASTGAELPFTGFAAIPVLLIGLALLGGGLVMRRSSRTG
jgi:uncharacterized iron-regulated membrane protein